MHFTDLNAVIVDVARFIERSAHLHNTAMTIELDPELPRVWVDEDQVKQVIMNMLVNAQHATAGGGSFMRDSVERGAGTDSRCPTRAPAMTSQVIAARRRRRTQ